MLKAPVVRQQGVGLVELMVAMAITLVVLSVALTAFMTLSTAAVDNLLSARLNHQVRSAMGLMVRELQRSGYLNWRAAWSLEDVDGDGKRDIRDFYLALTPRWRDMSALTISEDGSCILYSYDIDGNGSKGTGDFEHFGFRLDNGAIQMKTAGEHACAASGWQAITDHTVVVTGLSFELDVYQDTTGFGALYSLGGDGKTSGPVGICEPSSVGTGILPAPEDTLCLERRSVRILITARSAADPTMTMTLENRVKLKNDFLNAFRMAE